MTSEARTVLRPGVCSVTLRQLSIDEVVAATATAGLEGIEWGADVHVPPGDGPAIARARRATEAAGLTCASYGSYLSPASSDDEITAALATTEALGSSNIRVWAGGEEPTENNGRWGHDDWQGSIRGLGLIAEQAAQRGLTVGLEYHGWTLTHRGGAAAQLVSDIGADNLFTYFQPNYWDQPVVHDVAAQLAQLEPVLPHLSNLHLYWWPSLGERVPLTEGTHVLGPLLDAASAAGRWTADRWAFLEFVADDDPNRFAEDAATLLGLLDRCRPANPQG